MLRMNVCLVLAGGIGRRLTGCDKPKQFVVVGGKPLIMHCLETIMQCREIAHVCVVAAEEWRGLPGVYIYAEPGKSRQHSIYNGLLALRRYEPERVVIHDAARPLVTASDINGVIEASDNYDGAMPALAVTDTTYRSVDGKVILETLARDELFAGQTPECYDFVKYLAIHEKMSDDELSNTRGSSEIAVKNNMRIALCKGNPHNFKVTTDIDMERFRAVIESVGLK